MHLPTHALLSWLCAESATLERRDRLVVLAAGLLPDLDALTFLLGPEVYQAWHRVLLHNVAGACGTILLAAAASKRRVATALLAAASFHLHLLGDWIGAAGPDGSKWDVPYLVPFRHEGFVYEHQWGLASWQNVAVTVATLLVCAHLGARRGRTIVEAFSRRADAAVVEVLKRRWPFRTPVTPDTLNCSSKS